MSSHEKKEKAELRVKTIENQESKLKEKAESIRKEVMQELEKGDSKKE